MVRKLEVGEQINNWTFLRESPDKNNYGIFRCKCGTEKDLLIDNVLRGLSKQCRKCTSAKNCVHYVAISTVDDDIREFSSRRELRAFLGVSDTNLSKAVREGLNIKNWRISRASKHRKI